MIKTLFIGGTGNISESCVQRCLSLGQDVSVITRGSSSNIPDGVTAIVADRYNLDNFNNAIADNKFDVVINFVGYDIPELEIDYKIFAGKIKQYIFISSATVYKKPHTQIPITETYELGNPYSEYAQNKQKCEEWLIEKNSNNFPVTIVRPSHTFSEHWLPNIISSSTWTIPNRLIKKKPVFLHDGGKSLWTLTSSKDFAVGLCGLIGLEKSIGEAFHITSDEANSWKTIYDRYSIELGLKPTEYIDISTDFLCENFPEFISNLRGDKAENAIFDNSKIKSFVPEFKCEDTMTEAVKRSMKWFLADEERQIIDEDADEKIDKILKRYE